MAPTPRVTRQPPASRLLQSRWLLGMLAFGLFALPACLPAGQQAPVEDKPAAPEFDELVEQTRKELRLQRLRDCALVYRVRTLDGRRVKLRTELHYTGLGRGGYTPGEVRSGEAAVAYSSDGQPAELRITHPDYCEFSRPLVFTRGKVTVWDDIVLEPVRLDTAVRLKGTIRLEDDADARGISVSPWGGGTTAVTDAHGSFELLVRPGRMTITAQKTGYHGLQASINVAPGSTESCLIRGFRQRAALVAWAWQSDEYSPDLAGGKLITGRALLLPGTLDRVSFGKGFVQVDGSSDFLVLQEGKELWVRNFDITDSPAVPCIRLLGNVPFAEVERAPLRGWDRDNHTLQTGMAYAVLCFDGRHVAKMKVLQILDGLDAIENARKRLQQSARPAAPMTRPAPGR